MGQAGRELALSEFDAEKVASIKDAIAAGKFQINPEAIADSLIAVSRELLQNKS